ncbi:TetR family transcriptional regulator [Rhizocola hellebori]|uniref:TetR family transcriptional regulator n=1 Tax=Rhizocola hellebori TaxID=1392758 RepID=A0A8J3Q2M7_9ACTN|nr:TetR/AcrR family transcriptional regulator [Rhizocola hellebori]GIH02564.1 TetR family transcriptional regulator [Rhizocola hellebori]
MGNREALLDGAKRCLFEKGYTRTTARDIATAAGVSLAAIGYHFGSTEALLNEALFAAVVEWGNELSEALKSAQQEKGDRFEAVWRSIIASFPAHRPLWATQFELIGQIDRLPQLHDFLVQSQRTGRDELAQLFSAIDPASPSARAVGAFHQALLAGVMVQWLVDPSTALSAADLAEALRTVAAAGT